MMQWEGLTVVINNKKAEFEFETIIKWLIALIILIIVIVLIFKMKGKSFDIFDKIKNLLRFGN